MPIKISMKGTLSSGEPWTSYVGVASGLTSGLNPAGSMDLTTGDGTDAATDDIEQLQSQLDEVDLEAQEDGTMRADVYLVWPTAGVISTSLPDDSSESFDVASGTTRLLFKGIELDPSKVEPYEHRWTSEPIQLTTKPGVSHQFITAYFTRPGDDIAQALADDTAMIESPHAMYSPFVKLIYRLLG